MEDTVEVEAKEEKVESAEVDLEETVIDMYLPEENSEPREASITHVMLHFSSNALEKPENPFQVKDIYEVFREYEVSAHYVIDRTGQIYRFVSEDRIAYHAGNGKLEGFPMYEDNLNPYSIGIELLAIGTKEEMLPMMSAEHYDTISSRHIGYTKEQYDALQGLLMDISTRHHNLKLNRNHIIGHQEYASERKTDPGELFDWEKLMSRFEN
ncbi:N-acetylmuramoyl-L-alanine amidase [Oceanobacillus sp. 1P07AA]|uniref:N-acetylmuramoyl-L-alanine amidase n=1 Tax=Oceanobacillus sp. 1P07AA TaxID=3132293 RepID=UPI0039A58806